MTTTRIPHLRHRDSGGWLAVTAPSDELRIGVTADTEAEARESFDRAVEAWQRLLDKARGVSHGDAGGTAA